MALRTLILAAACALLPLVASADDHLLAPADEAYGQKGYVGEAYGQKGYVPPVAYHPTPAPTYHAPRKKAVKIVTLPPCPANYTGMYRGTLYCIEGKLVH